MDLERLETDLRLPARRLARITRSEHDRYCAAAQKVDGRMTVRGLLRLSAGGWHRGISSFVGGLPGSWAADMNRVALQAIDDADLEELDAHRRFLDVVDPGCPVETDLVPLGVGCHDARSLAAWLLERFELLPTGTTMRIQGVGELGEWVVLQLRIDDGRLRSRLAWDPREGRDTDGARGRIAELVGFGWSELDGLPTIVLEQDDPSDALESRLSYRLDALRCHFGIRSRHPLRVALAPDPDRLDPIGATAVSSTRRPLPEPFHEGSVTLMDARDWARHRAAHRADEQVAEVSFGRRIGVAFGALTLDGSMLTVRGLFRKRVDLGFKACCRGWWPALPQAVHRQVDLEAVAAVDAHDRIRHAVIGLADDVCSLPPSLTTLRTSVRPLHLGVVGDADAMADWLDPLLGGSRLRTEIAPWVGEDPPPEWDEDDTAAPAAVVEDDVGRKGCSTRCRVGGLVDLEDPDVVEHLGALGWSVDSTDGATPELVAADHGPRARHTALSRCFTTLWLVTGTGCEDELDITASRVWTGGPLPM